MDWLDPADYAAEQMAEHAGQYPQQMSGEFFAALAGRMEQMLAACDHHRRKRTRWVGVAWRKVYYQLVTARCKHGNDEDQVVRRGHRRATCVSLTAETGADLDPSVFGADAAAADPMDLLAAADGLEGECDPGDDWLRANDPAWADSARTKTRRNTSIREMQEAIARSAAHCAALAGRVGMGAAAA